MTYLYPNDDHIANSKSPSNQLKSVSAASGTGKTRAAVRKAIENVEKLFKKTIISSPTIILQNETVEMVKELRPNLRFRVFNHDECAKRATVDENGISHIPSVVHELNQFFKLDAAGEATEELIFVTHAGLFQLLYPNVKDWTLYVDEAPQVLKSFSYRIPCTHAMLTDHFDKVSQAGAIYCELKPNDRLQEIADNEREDEVFGMFGEWVRTLCNANWRTLIHETNFADLLTGRFDWFQPECVLDPRLLHRFREATILSANFEETFCFRLWSALGVEFVENMALTRELREMPQNADLLIKYSLDTPWSAKKAETVIDGKTMREWMIAIVDKDMKARGLTLEQGSLTLDNKKYDHEELFSWANTAPLPARSEGLNIYQAYNNVIVLGAYNPAPHTIAFLKNHFALDAGGIKDAVMHQNLYQAVMRSSLRNPDNHDQKVFYVPDLGCAEYLAGMYPGARLHKFGDMNEPRSGRPRQHASDKDRKAAKRQELRDEKRRLMVQQTLASCATTHQTSPPQNCPETLYKISYKGINGQIQGGDVWSEKIPESNQSFGSVFSDVFSKTPAFYIRSLAVEQQIELLHELWTRTVANKESAAMLSPATFKDGRTYEHIASIFNIWFDFENGDLSSDEFAKLFPRIKMVIFNSYRHTKAKPRFRVVMFTSTPLTIEAYKLIYKMVRTKLMEAGYHTKITQPHKTMEQSGMDWSKHTPTSLFYLPAQAEVADDSFFHVHDGDGREPIDVIAWVKNYHEPVIVEEEPVVTTDPDIPATEAPPTVNELKKQTVINHWRTAHKNTGNEAWKTLAIGLAGANVPLAEIEMCLHAELEFAPKKYRRKLKSQIRPLVAFMRKNFRPRQENVL
jgi:hypothetical protein